MIAHLVACTATAILAVIAAFLFARRSARWRHAILLAAVLRFAVPTGWLSSTGEMLIRFAPPAAPSHGVADEVADLLLAKRGVAAVRRAVTPSKPVLPFFWAAGFTICAALWMRRWSRYPATVRPPNEAESGAFHQATQRLPCPTAVRLAIVDPEFTPGVRGLRRACILLPDGLSSELSDAELETVIAHELAHVQRHDNLVALLTHAIVAAFWFHPLVWWMERRMLLEREIACDEMVLAGGVPADIYAAGILRVCHRSLNLSGVYAAFTGPNLVQRMEHIMSVDSRSSRSFLSRAALCGLIAFTLLTPVGAGFLAARPLPAPQAVPPPQTTPPAVMNQVEDLVNQGKADEAIDLLQNEIKRSPNRLDLQIALGNVAVRAKRFDLAIGTFQEALNGLDRGSKAASDLHLRLGETYRRKGDFDPAIESLRRAKELAPNNATIVSTLALTLDAADRIVEAKDEYEAVLALDPDNFVALNNLAYMLAYRNGNLDRALELAKRARDLKPDLIEIWDTLGWIQLKRNMAADAIATFREAIQAAPSNPIYHYHLGMGFAQKGDNDAAIAELRTALTLDPSSKDREKIRQLLDRLQR